MTLPDLIAEQNDAAPSPLVGTHTAAVSRGRLVLRRFVRKRMALLGAVTLALLFMAAFIGPHLTKWSYSDTDYSAFLKPPSRSHWFGTSQIGQDMYAQTMRGLQKSLIIGLLAALVTTGVAAIVGACAGYFGGWIDRFATWVIDLLLVLPSFLITAILSPAFRGKTWLLFVLLLSAFYWMITARVVRGLTLSLREREFIKAAQFMGVPSRKIIFRHLLPNMASLLIIDATINVGGTIVLETSLSYFGLGIQPPDVSLGTLIADGTNFALTFPWMFLFAAGLLILTVLSVSLVGDGLRDALDPTAGSGRSH